MLIDEESSNQKTIVWRKNFARYLVYFFLVGCALAIAMIVSDYYRFRSHNWNKATRKELHEVFDKLYSLAISNGLDQDHTKVLTLPEFMAILDKRTLDSTNRIIGTKIGGHNVVISLEFEELTWPEIIEFDFDSKSLIAISSPNPFGPPAPFRWKLLSDDSVVMDRLDPIMK